MVKTVLSIGADPTYEKSIAHLTEVNCTSRVEVNIRVNFYQCPLAKDVKGEDSR